MTGQTIAHYHIGEKLGAGGMGIVYRATDTKLNRQVALKVLPEEFARDSERMARFAREAQMLAALNHPNIAAIHGLEEADGVRALAMELVEGPTLAERIAQGPLPLEEALHIAKQVAEALEAAHERGIIHRDLKPANIKVKEDGQVKVLDFGLAKALEGGDGQESLEHSPTLSVAATSAGFILGTAAYMSPEQARGHRADRRADIWSFGVVLFEMLTGRQLFTGETTSDVLARVLTAEVGFESLPAGTPPQIAKLLRRCLTNDRKQRLQAIGEARIAIEAALTGKGDEPIVLAAASGPRLGARQWAFLAAGLAITALVAGAVGWSLRPLSPEPPVRKLSVPVEGREILGGLRSNFAVSPDGRKLAYLSRNQLWIREMDQLDARPVPGSEGAAIPFWSPDSATVGFAASGKLWRFPLGASEPIAICDLQGSMTGGSGATWGPDNTIVFSQGESGLLQVSARGGDPRILHDFDPEKEDDLHQPHFLPEGRGILFVVHRKEGLDTLALFSQGERKVLLQLEGQSIWIPVYSPTGHILYRREPTNAGIWALPFSLSRLEATGEAFLVAPEGDNPTVGWDGTLAYVRQASSRLTQLVWVNRDGKVLEPVGPPREHLPLPALSPDERRVAISVIEQDNEDVWIIDLVRGTRTRLTFAPEPENMPAWSPSGNEIYFVRGDDPANFTIFRKPADGSGEAGEVVKAYTPHLSTDGQYLAFTFLGEGSQGDLGYLRLQGEEEPKPVVFLQTPAPARENWPRFSPDGRYLAYQSSESGRVEIYLKRFPGGEGKWQVSVNGGNWPRWSRKGDRLYFTEGSTIMEVEVTTRPSLLLGAPRALFTRVRSGLQLPFSWPDPFEVSGDGQRFLTLQPAEEVGGRSDSEITVVQNWFAEFREKQKP